MTSIGFKAWWVFLLLLVISGCFVRAPLQGQRARPRPVEGGPPVWERDLTPVAPPQQSEEEAAPAPSKGVPAEPVPARPGRPASQRLVEDGEKFLAGAEYERALYKFEEAINIDPSNGCAYYYMAQTQAELGAYDEAGGLLDKAESLLGRAAPWGERIVSLRQQIRQGAY